MVIIIESDDARIRSMCADIVAEADPEMLALIDLTTKSFPWKEACESAKASVEAGRRFMAEHYPKGVN